MKKMVTKNNNLGDYVLFFSGIKDNFVYNGQDLLILKRSDLLDNTQHQYDFVYFNGKLLAFNLFEDNEFIDIIENKKYQVPKYIDGFCIHNDSILAFENEEDSQKSNIFDVFSSEVVYELSSKIRQAIVSVPNSYLSEHNIAVDSDKGNSLVAGLHGKLVALTEKEPLTIFESKDIIFNDFAFAENELYYGKAEDIDETDEWGMPIIENYATLKLFPKGNTFDDFFLKQSAKLGTSHKGKLIYSQEYSLGTELFELSKPFKDRDGIDFGKEIFSIDDEINSFCYIPSELTHQMDLTKVKRLN